MVHLMSPLVLCCAAATTAVQAARVTGTNPVAITNSPADIALRGLNEQVAKCMQNAVMSNGRVKPASLDLINNLLGQRQEAMRYLVNAFIYHRGGHYADRHFLRAARELANFDGTFEELNNQVAQLPHLGPCLRGVFLSTVESRIFEVPSQLANPDPALLYPQFTAAVDELSRIMVIHFDVVANMNHLRFMLENQAQLEGAGGRAKALLEASLSSLWGIHFAMQRFKKAVTALEGHHPQGVAILKDAVGRMQTALNFIHPEMLTQFVRQHSQSNVLDEDDRTNALHLTQIYKLPSETLFRTHAAPPPLVVQVHFAPVNVPNNLVAQTQAEQAKITATAAQLKTDMETLLWTQNTVVESSQAKLAQVLGYSKQLKQSVDNYEQYCISLQNTCQTAEDSIIRNITTALENFSTHLLVLNLDMEQYNNPYSETATQLRQAIELYQQLRNKFIDVSKVRLRRSVGQNLASNINAS